MPLSLANADSWLYAIARFLRVEYCPSSSREASDNRADEVVVVEGISVYCFVIRLCMGVGMFDLDGLR